MSRFLCSGRYRKSIQTVPTVPTEIHQEPTTPKVVQTSKKVAGVRRKKRGKSIPWEDLTDKQRARRLANRKYYQTHRKDFQRKYRERRCVNMTTPEITATLQKNVDMIATQLRILQGRVCKK